jgi:hypothetical protein
MRRVEFILNKPTSRSRATCPTSTRTDDAPPKGFSATLRSYQQTGYDWMRYLRRAGLHGVLADDMGLGKTHQTMAFLLSTYEEGAKKPSLIVAPTSVMDNWMQKIRDFAPSLRPLPLLRSRAAARDPAPARPAGDRDDLHGAGARHRHAVVDGVGDGRARRGAVHQDRRRRSTRRRRSGCRRGRGWR